MITYPTHQPLQFPSADPCACYPSTCFKVRREDVTQFQVSLDYYSGEELLLNGEFNPYVTGVCDLGSSLTTFVDVEASFQNFGVQPGWAVKNVTTGAQGQVVTVLSQNAIVTDITPWTLGDTYQLYAWDPDSPPGWLFNGTQAIGAGEGETMTGFTPDLCTESAYIVKVVVSALADEQAFRIILGGSGDQFSTPDGPGTYYFYFPPAAYTSGIQVLALVGTIIDSISVKQLSSVSLLVKDCNTGEVIYADYQGTSVEYNSGVFSAEGLQRAVITLDWTTFEDGCYQVCLIDAGDLCKEWICNGEFDTITGNATSTSVGKLVDNTERFTLYGLQIGTSAINLTTGNIAGITSVDSDSQLSVDANIFTNTNSWQIANCWRIQNNNGDWEFGGGEAIHTGTGGDYLYQHIDPLNEDCCYELTFDYEIESGELEVRWNADADAPLSTDLLLGTFTSEGISATIEICGKAVERITFTSNEEASFVASIDNVSLHVKPSTDEDPQYTCCELASECICLEAWPCTSAVAATNNENIDTGNTFLDFTSFTWSMLLRSEVKFWHPKKRDRNYQLYVSDSGAGVKVHADRSDVWMTVFERMPSYRIMSLWDMVTMDTFTIDGVNYYTEQTDLDPDYDDYSDDAEVEVELIKDNDKFENING
jgi:hypothetical protein